MTIRFRQGFTEKVVDVDYIEIEGMEEAEVKDGKWVFKDDDSKRIMG